MVTFMTGLLLTCRTIPVCTDVRKPCKVASRLYGPSGKLATTYNPSASVTVVLEKPVSVWVAVTVTPGKIAPLESLTVPLI
jgi:hypothetical protein